MMRAIAIQGSPEKERGTTAQVLNPFLEGMRSEGCQVDTYYSRGLKVKPCFGDFACWGKTPGECALKDDMQILYPKFRDADIWVFGVPYYCIMPGEVQNLLNRLVALTEPRIRSEGGVMVPTRRPELKVKHIVLVSTCYFWEPKQFDPLVSVFEKLGKILGVGPVELLLRPHASVFVQLLGSDPRADAVQTAAQAAGTMLVRGGSIPEELVRSIAQPLISREEFIRMHDEQF
jgi:hypothetical protein